MIDSKQIDKTDWNDHSFVLLDNTTGVSNIFNPLNETTYQVVRKGNDYSAKIFYFDSKISSTGPEPICDGREHKISYLNNLATSIEVEVGLSAYESSANSILRDSIGTVILQPWNMMTIYFYWVKFGGIRYCIVHHVIT